MSLRARAHKLPNEGLALFIKHDCSSSQHSRERARYTQLFGKSAPALRIKRGTLAGYAGKLLSLCDDVMLVILYLCNVVAPGMEADREV